MHIPLHNSYYINTNFINFEELKYERESTRNFMICNEGEDDINIMTKYLTEQSQLDEKYEFELGTRRSRISSVLSYSSFTTLLQAMEPSCVLVAYKHFRLHEEVCINFIA